MSRHTTYRHQSRRKTALPDNKHHQAHLGPRPKKLPHMRGPGKHQGYLGRGY
jgi:hypothetical protein